MTNNPDVSVVMAVYNGQQYVEESINSILSQSYSNFEFIIVDDGSNDLTSQILLDAQSKDKRIFLITNETNKGISYSLNSAIAISRGEYIARMDSDDIAISNRLELQLEFLRKHSECVIVGGKIEVIGDSAHTVEINQFSDWYNQHSHSEDIKKAIIYR
ncbi:glycosyltransferase family 2 protein [Cohnella ginsengisoli]|uniref:Glycosyltransferase family 2 protein n=1 Tax=Cohnella ginsengisoli TaxID=425004 RepID=A0A9X4KMA6_9BACL|nr:glycosyltransferase family A protein [Cohnella ginsengisoli]MDG0794591.1 glycosyltransferase family 2 protein [Cohnella ginsengisoli]